MALAKVHGSISWDQRARYTDGRRGLSGEALIIAPTPNKALQEELEDQWNLARKILLGSTSLIVFGFAFNPYDSAFLDHLREHGTKLKSVLLINKTDLREPAVELWPNAKITYVKPPPEGYGGLRSWKTHGLGKQSKPHNKSLQLTP